MVGDVVKAIGRADDAFGVMKPGIHCRGKGGVVFEGRHRVGVDGSEFGQGGHGHVNGVNETPGGQPDVVAHPIVDVVDNVGQAVGVGLNGSKEVKVGIALPGAVAVGIRPGIAVGQDPVDKCAPLHCVIINVGVLIQPIQGQGALHVCAARPFSARPPSWQTRAATRCGPMIGEVVVGQHQVAHDLRLRRHKAGDGLVTGQRCE